MKKLRYYNYPQGYHIYSFVADDGRNTHIDVPRIRAWVTANLKSLTLLGVVITQEHRTMARRWFHDGTVSTARCVELMKHWRENPNTPIDPVIFCEYPGRLDAQGNPDQMLVDGHHRFAIAADIGSPVCPGVCLTVPQWKPFKIYGHPGLTQSQLRMMPVPKRNYLPKGDSE